MFPRWLSWLVFLALAYVIYSASQINAPVQLAKPIVPAITSGNYPALAEATDVEHWKRTIDPAYAAKMNCTLEAPKAGNALTASVIETAAGDGAAAVCGERILTHLSVWGTNGEKTYDGEVALALGSRELAAGLDHGLVGIKPGGERLLVLPPFALVRAKSDKALPAAKFLPTGKLALVTVRRVS